MVDTAMKIYGPYTRRDGRKHVIIYDGITRRTMSYPKFLLQKFLGRELTKNETADHINNNFTDDRLENLQVLTRGDNIRKSFPGKETLRFECPVCHFFFQREARYYRHNQISQGKTGPFCSRQCAGRYNAGVLE